MRPFHIPRDHLVARTIDALTYARTIDALTYARTGIALLAAAVLQYKGEFPLLWIIEGCWPSTGVILSASVSALVVETSAW